MLPATEQALTEKIQRLEQQVKTLNADLRAAKTAAITPMLGQLRMREVVLLYIGNQDTRTLEEKLCEEFGPLANDCMRHLYDLNNAPFGRDTQETLRAAFNHGMRRW